jgi:large subunit ribosomal protein L9
MQVLLLKNVPGIGTAGQVKKVADGYARNYLLPNHLAMPATDGAVKQSVAIKEASARREAKTLGEAQELAKILAQTTLTFRAKAGQGDHLFGSITSADIADKLVAEKNIHVDKRKIDLPNPIKDLGEHKVPVKIHSDVIAAVNVLVEREAA